MTIFFEAHLNKRQFEELKRAVVSLINPAEDSVRYYPLCKTCAGRVEVPAVGDVTPAPKTIVV